MSLHDNHRLLIAVAALGFLFLSLTVAVFPAYEAQKTPPVVRPPDTAEIRRGRELYLREGCGVCHTQFVRNLAVDAPYGRGSVAGDFADEDPPLLGTQRTGPDLADVGARQPSEAWHLLHLYDPRAVVANSVMPAYPWYFRAVQTAGPDDVVIPVAADLPEGYRIVATRDAIALVRYLQSLEQPVLEP
ncbi:MAG: cbb3-type cytochrome c oxidase subunit II [Pseudomonadota bacterium]